MTWKNNTGAPSLSDHLLIYMAILILLSNIQSCKKESNPPDHDPPIANAGPDIKIKLPVDSVLLDGSGSRKTIAEIKLYEWRALTGNTVKIHNPGLKNTIVSGFLGGAYSFELRVVDIDGFTSRDTVLVTVDEKDHAPAAFAGEDQILSVPHNNYTTLDGSLSSDLNNNISSYLWRKIEGPQQFTLSGESGKIAQLKDLVEGVYQFELKVTDSTNLFALDTIKISVIDLYGNSAPEIGYFCQEKFTDKTETLIVYWSSIETPLGLQPFSPCSCLQVSGPTSAIIKDVGYTLDDWPAFRVSDLIKGKYVFKLICKNKDKADEKQITLQVVEDTLRGKEYFLETVWNFDSNHNKSFSYVNNRPDLFYKAYENLKDLAIKYDSTGEWVSVNTPPYPYPISNYLNYFVESYECMQELQIGYSGPTAEKLKNKKVQIRVSFK